MLGVGVGVVVRVQTVGNCKMLEDTGDFQPRQSIAGFHLAHGLVKVGAQVEADAPHASVRLEMAAHGAAGLGGCTGQLGGVLGGEQRLSDAQRSQLVGKSRVGVAQDEQRLGQAVTAQMPGFRQTADRKGGHPGLVQGLGHSHAAVTVGVGLEDSADVAAHGAADQSIVGKQCVEIDLGPAVFFKTHG